MLYSHFVDKLVRQSFDHVNNRRWDELLKPSAPNVQHRFDGSHSIGGERHDKEAMHRWLERLGRVKVNRIWATGWPWDTTVFVQWDATATLLNGDDSYFNRGLPVISRRWTKCMHWTCLKIHKKWTVVLPPKPLLTSKRLSPTKL